MFWVAKGRTQACQMRNRTSGEDLVVLERREVSYRILYATAVMVRYTQLIFSCFIVFILLNRHISSAPSTAGTHTGDVK